jgi:hypothetical protein
VKPRRSTANFVPKTKEQEANMRKLITAAVAFLVIGLWLMPVRAAAQGRGVGKPDGASGGFGSHASLGAPGADVDNKHGSAHDTTTTGAKDVGRKTPDQLLSENTKLSDHLSGLLSKMNLLNVNGMPLTVQQACANFKNLGQCVASIHVANNLGVSFNALACTELGTKVASSPSSSLACPSTVTNTSRMSLGAAIDALKPGTDGKTEAQKAATQANQDLKG